MIEGRHPRCLIPVATRLVALKLGFRGQTPLPIVPGTFQGPAHLPVVLLRLRGCTPFPLVAVGFLDNLLRFGGRALVLYNLHKAGKLGIHLAIANPRSGIVSARGPRASGFAVLPDCTQR